MSLEEQYAKRARRHKRLYRDITADVPMISPTEFWLGHTSLMLWSRFLFAYSSGISNPKSTKLRVASVA